jgi:hypothetical protein
LGRLQNHQDGLEKHLVVSLICRFHSLICRFHSLFFLFPLCTAGQAFFGAPAENSQISNVAKAKNFPYLTLISSHFHYLGTTTLTSLPTPASLLASLSPTA